MTESAEPGSRDRRIEVLLATVLRGGVMLSALIVLVGGLTFVAANGRMLPAYEVFRGEPAELRSIAGIVASALAWHSSGLIQFGLLLLIATPIARVVLSVLAFARERDWLYVAITAVVLALLTYSLLGAG
jgi:uncharacterized membrane protein